SKASEVELRFRRRTTSSNAATSSGWRRTWATLVTERASCPLRRAGRGPLRFLVSLLRLVEPSDTATVSLIGLDLAVPLASVRRDLVVPWEDLRAFPLVVAGNSCRTGVIQRLSPAPSGASIMGKGWLRFWCGACRVSGDSSPRRCSMPRDGHPPLRALYQYVSCLCGQAECHCQMLERSAAAPPRRG